MRSFISGFRSLTPASRATLALIAGCAAIVVAAETVVRVGFNVVSTIQRRMATEYHAAIGARASTSGHVALFVGNSLLNEGLQFDVIQTHLAPEWDVRRFVVEQTFYYDWYYGLRRLFADGARPDVVVIVLTPLQWIRDDMRGDYTAYHLMTVGDAASAARSLNMARTAATGFMLASVSEFWSARAELRNFLMGRVLPGFGQLMNATSVVDLRVLDDDDVERVVTKRFEQCREIADAHGARLVALVPPVLESRDGAEGLLRAGRRAGVTVFAPVRSGTYPTDFYRDAGYHLNTVGANRFTTEIIDSLHATLERILSRSAAAM
jgi:hypothetical protein